MNAGPDWSRTTTGGPWHRPPDGTTLDPALVHSALYPPSAKSVTVVQNARRSISQVRGSESREFGRFVFFAPEQRIPPLPSVGHKKLPKDGGGGVICAGATAHRKGGRRSRPEAEAVRRASTGGEREADRPSRGASPGATGGSDRRAPPGRAALPRRCGAGWWR